MSTRWAKLNLYDVLCVCVCVLLWGVYSDMESKNTSEVKIFVDCAVISCSDKYMKCDNTKNRVEQFSKCLSIRSSIILQGFGR